MEDRRIQKTKKNIKNTLMNMLTEKSFEKINVTDICKVANISRITFYSHYNDKYALVEEIFEDFVSISKIIFYKKQLENNIHNDSVKSYCNILDTIFDLFDRYPSFFSCISPDKNPYLSLQLYDYVLKTVELHTKEESHTHILRYSPRQITAFLCFGLAGFINESQNEGMDKEVIKQQTKQLLMDTVRSNVIIK
ncbi:TetR family transcriptional regulator [Floccifex sp.]|uniref:TetR family transcriptional regulator n=1 Tax=Floccifex sp. TaxID=2815810 RepID=UPI003F05DA17